MKLNEFICPRCGHRWFDSASYGTCDACGTFFYLSARASLNVEFPQKVLRHDSRGWTWHWLTYV